MQWDNTINAGFNKGHKTWLKVNENYLNGINAIVSEWLKNGCNKSIKEISKIITICIYGLKRE